MVDNNKLLKIYRKWKMGNIEPTEKFFFLKNIYNKMKRKHKHAKPFVIFDKLEKIVYNIL